MTSVTATVLLVVCGVVIVLILKQIARP